MCVYVYYLLFLDIFSIVFLGFCSLFVFVIAICYVYTESRVIEVV